MSVKNGNNHFTYTEPILAHQFLCCLWSVQSGVVISRLGGEVLIVSWMVAKHIIEEYKN